MGELTWLPSGEHGKKELYWRNSPSDPWKAWKMHPLTKGCDRAYSAAQFLLTKGFKYVD